MLDPPTVLGILSHPGVDTGRLAAAPDPPGGDAGQYVLAVHLRGKWAAAVGTAGVAVFLALHGGRPADHGVLDKFICVWTEACHALGVGQDGLALLLKDRDDVIIIAVGAMAYDRSEPLVGEELRLGAGVDPHWLGLADATAEFHDGNVIGCAVFGVQFV